MKGVYDQREGFMGLFKESGETKKEEADSELVKNMEATIKNVQDATNKAIEEMNITKDRRYWRN